MAEYTHVEEVGDPDHPAVVVEDEDGFRVLLLSGEPVLPIRVWQRAYDASTALIVLNDTQAISTDDFLRTRVEVPSRAAYQIVGLKVFSPHPAFRDYHLGQQEQAQADPLATTRFVHLHCHSEFSQLDGLATIAEIMETVTADPNGGGAVGLSDHGNCAGHPELQAQADKYGLKPIFGMEAYFVPDRFRRSESWVEYDGARVNPADLTDAEAKKAERKNDSAEVKSEYTHLTLWAMDEVGLRNLWAISTEAYRDGLYDGKPRMDWDTLERLNEGIICGTGCLRGPVSRPLMDGDVAAAQQALLRLHGIFGDRLYVEVHTNSLESQVKVNRHLEQFCADYGIPPLAAVDSHYAIPEHKIIHKTWLAMQTGKTLTEDTTLFQGDQDYHLKTTEEVVESLVRQGLPDSFIHEAMANTVEVARRCTATVGGQVTTPTFSKPNAEHPDPVQRDIERLFDICLANWERKVVGKRRSAEEYLARFEREMKLLIAKGFCGYFLIVNDYVSWAKAQGCLVGAGRGSGGGSLVAYLADIVETDPVDSDLIFERFLTEGRNSLPDFDIDFPASWRGRILGYLRDRWGTDYVSNIGTVTRLRTKAAINDVCRVLAPVLPYELPFKRFEALKKVIDAADAPLAGKHLPWEEFCAQYADLVDPMIADYPEVFAVVDVVMDRVKTYGKHAAGVVISTSGPLTNLPMRLAVDSKTKTEVMVTQFDMNALEILGYVKFDILTLRTLDTLQVAVDLIEEKYGRKVSPYDWIEEYGDPQVWQEVAAGHTLGLFQIETSSGTRLTKRLAPQNLFDLAAVMTVVRPGPMRSGLTESYLRRRAGLEQVTYPDPRLEEFLGDTYGATIYQEQVMATCMNLAGYDSTEADAVRKLLGKKQVEKVVAAGEEFVRRAVQCGTDRGVAETLWSQMSEFAKYCVAGDTEISLAGANRLGGGTITAAALYRRLHAEHGPRRPGQDLCDGCDRPLRPRATVTLCSPCRCWRTKFHDPERGLSGLSYYADERIRPARILDVLDNGERETFTVTLADGKTITATGNHRHLSDKGFRRLDELAVGDRILVDAGYEPQRYDPTKHRLTRGVARRTGTVNGAFGEENYAYRDGGAAFWSAWKAANPKVCAQCGEDQGRIEVAHLDGDHAHNVEGNLAWLCASCHKAYDYAVNDRRRRWQKGHLVEPVEIVAIEPAGVQRVYDLVMDAPHNFVANGTICHNSFNKAHAFAYAVLGFWCAFLRFHYPVEFLVAALSTVDDDRIPEFIEDCRRNGYSIVPPDVNRSSVHFTAEGTEVIYGLAMVKGIGVNTAQQVVSMAPYTGLEDFLERCVRFSGSAVNMGHVKTLVEVGAFDSLVGNRRAVEQQLDADSSGAAKRCVFKIDQPNPEHPFNVPCTFDWPNEPDPPLLPKGRGKAKVMVAKPPPKKCSISCRSYTPPPPIDPALVLPYSPEEIMRRERELLGVWITHSPFGGIDPEVIAESDTAQQIEEGRVETAWVGVGLVEGVRERPDKTGQRMAFVTLNMQDGEIEALCFSSLWGSKVPVLHKDDLGMAVVRKTPRGYQLTEFVNL